MLRGIHLFQPLSQDELLTVARNVHEEIYSAGERIVRQGDERNTFFIIKTGRVRIVLEDNKGEPVLEQLTDTEFFGEVSLLTGAKRHASVIADEDMKVFTLAHRILGWLLQANTSLAEDLAREANRNLLSRAPYNTSATPREGPGF